MNDAFDPGSFKDPEGRICLVGGKVYRTLTPGAAERMSEIAAAGALDDLAARHLLIPTRVVTAVEAGLDSDTFGETLLHHERIPLLTYPFEWSFDMLRDAALTTLDVLESCLGRGLILKDATAYNVALHQGRMVFFDTLSIDRYAQGSPWEGYAQFCREFLFPLMMVAYRSIEFQSWFRGQLDGFALADFARLFSWHDYLRKGVVRHVVLQWRLEKSFADKNPKVRASFRDIKFSTELIVANLRNLRQLIEGLAYRPSGSAWIDYADQNTYSDAASRAKADFVARAIERIAPQRLVDLGCNIGDISLIAAERVAEVAAVDIDAACINALYRRIRADGVRNLVPIVGDLLNPTPEMGWNLSQRRSLFERIRSDAFLALALVHHICIGGNVPLEAFLDLLREIAPAGVIEWVDKGDAMVQKMLRNRADVFADYRWVNFERLLRERFTLENVVESHNGARKLCLVLPRNS